MDFKQRLAELLSEKIENLTVDDIYSDLEVPKNVDMGDYSFPCFKLAKVFRKAPNMIAEQLATGIQADFLESVENVNAYINFKVKPEAFGKALFEELEKTGDDYGSSTYGEGKNVVVEFSSANIAKPFHIGHIRSTMIGNSLYRIYKTLGYNAVAVNHLGDYGTQFGKLIVAYKEWGDREVIEKDPINELLKLYVKFHKEAGEKPELEDRARECFTKLEKGDKEMYDLWSWIKELSLNEFKRVYKMLGVEFDSYAGESFYSDKMDEVLEILREKKIVKKDQGAEIVDLEPYGMPNCLITKSDGSTLYITRDLAAAIYRHREYNFDKNIYVVAYEQDLHFKQWFRVLEMMGFDCAKDCIHVNFGMVSLEEGKLTTRQGKVVFLEDVLNKSIEMAKSIIESKNPDLENKDVVAAQIGVGSIVFQDLFNQRIKDYTFSWDNALSFEGETAPYVQYAHARANAILEKSGVDVSYSDIDYSKLNDPSALELVKLILNFNDVIMDAMRANEPSKLTRYSVKLASSFNRFYHENHINTDDEATKKARLALTKATKQVIKKALWLIGIEAPDKM